MAGVVSPSMWVFVLRDEAHQTSSWCTLNEGLGKVLRYGAYAPDVIDRLRWMGGVLGPALAAALRAAGREPGGEARGPVVVIAFDQAHMGEYFAVATELRNAGIPAEVYLGSSGMRPQMKYADRRMAPAAIMLGGDEIAAGTVTIKDLDLGRELASGVADNAAWKAERPGQQTIPRGELVAAVKTIIGG